MCAIAILMYVADMLLVRKIAREEKEKEMQEEEDSEEARSRELSEKAGQAYMLYKKNDSILVNLEKEPLQDIVCFLCYHEKKGDTYSADS